MDKNDICWVTGAFGFIGRRVAKELARQGKYVLGVGHGSWPTSESKSWGLNCWVSGDLTASNFNFLKDTAGVPAQIYHLAGGSSVSAALQNPLEDFRRNVEASAQLLEWVRQESPETRLVVSSSAAVYGNSQSHQIKESQEPTPFSTYGYNKSMVEDLCRSYGFNFGIKSVIARIFSVYGTGLKRQLLWDICSKLHNEPRVLRLAGTGEELRDWVHVEDAVLALININDIADATTPIINIGTGIGTSVHSVASAIMSNWHAGSDSSCELIFDGKSRPGDPFSLVADVSKLDATGIKLGREVVPELRHFVEWYKALNNQS